MIIHTTIKPGDYMCLTRAYTQKDWIFNCVANFSACVGRAHEIEKKGEGISVMIVQIAATAIPDNSLIWNSVLTQKITEGT